MQPAGAFKIRGAYNMLAQLPPGARDAGVITYSSGNHGQAVALAARLLGIRAVVVDARDRAAGEGRWCGAPGAEVILCRNDRARSARRAPNPRRRPAG